MWLSRPAPCGVLRVPILLRLALCCLLEGEQGPFRKHLMAQTASQALMSVVRGAGQRATELAQAAAGGFVGRLLVCLRPE